jgi:hypothetical protein
LDPPIKRSARLAAQHCEVEEASASTGAGEDALPNSDFTGLERELPLPFQEEEVEPGEAAEHVAPHVLLYTPVAYTLMNMGEGSAFNGRSSSMEGGDSSQESSDEDDFYNVGLSEDAKGWPPELLHRPRQRRQKR